MDHAVKLQHLARAEQHISQGTTHIVHQREIVARLKRYGFETASARKTLQIFEDMQRLHIQNRDRLRQELGL
jgi:hypothetical protein